MPSAATLSWVDWGRIAEWVGDLPFALDLLNRSLALNAMSPQELLHRVESAQLAATAELDRLREALRGQVPKNAVRGVTEALSISFESLDDTARQTAWLLAQLAPAPIPEAFIEALPDHWKSPAVRAAMQSRHFVTSGDGRSFGVMHRVIADFLRSLTATSGSALVRMACDVLRKIMTPDAARIRSIGRR